MAKQFIAEVSIEINAKKSIVWDALTKPELVKQYFFGTEVISDWKVGKPIIFQGEWEGKKYEDKGTILELEKDTMLRYNYWSSMSGTPDIPENYAVVMYKLSFKNNATLLTITQDSIATEESKKHSEQNWGMVLEGLKKLAED